MEVLKLKNSHYLNYKGHFYLENGCVFGRSRTLLEVSGDFAGLNMLQLSVERCGSVSVLSVDMF